MMLCRRQRVIARTLEQSTAFPFLYHTQTITRHYATASDTTDETRNDDSHYPSKNPAPRNPSRNPSHPRSRNHDNPREFSGFVPFEDTGTRHDVDFKGSTITPKERKAFESLLKLQEKKDGRVTNSKGLQQAAEKTSGSKSAPNILDEVMESIGEEGSDEDFSTLAPRPQRTKARDARERHQKQDQNQSDAIAAAAEEDLNVVGRLLGRARTDVELWEILQKKVFDRVRVLNLDDAPEKKKSKKQQQQQQTAGQAEKTANPPSSKTKTQPSISDLDILTHTLPTHLTRAHAILARSFPASPLPLTMIPYLRRLGPGAFALGTSTQLYNQHMHTLFRRTLDLDAIIATLSEMDAQVYPFNERTEALLGKVLVHARQCQAGESGEGVRELWVAGGMRRRVGKIFRWMRIVKERREEEALREARSKEAEAEREDGDAVERVTTAAKG